MKVIIENIYGNRRTFENAISFQQFPDRDSPRIVVYVTTLENETETTEKLEFWDSVEIIIGENR